MSIKNQRTPDARRLSGVVRVRLRPEEAAGLKQFAANLGQSPSRIIRRLIREAINGGPDYFKDELVDLRGATRELAAIGRNLNQLSHAANRGEAVSGPTVRRVVNAALVQTEAVKALYVQALETVAERAVGPFQEASQEEANG